MIKDNTISIHTKQLVDGIINESYTKQTKGRFSKFKDMIKNHFNPETHCVRRCGFYKNCYGVVKKSDIKKDIYESKTGCSGIPWIAFEGKYSECCDFVLQNRN